MIKWKRVRRTGGSTSGCFVTSWGGTVGMSIIYSGELLLGGAVLEKWCIAEVYSLAEKGEFICSGSSIFGLMTMVV